MKTVAGQGGVVFLGAAAGGLLVAQQVAAKATRDALFLTHYPPALLPVVMMGASGASVVCALAFARLLAAQGPRRAVPLLVGAYAALLLGGFLLTSWAPRAAAVLVYLLVSAVG